MFGTVVAAGSKALGGARFGLVSLLPGVVLVAVVLATIRSGAYGSGPVRFSAVLPGPGDLTAGGAVVLLFAVFLAGVLIQPFQVALVQILEGYWGSGVYGRTVGVLAIELHRRRLRGADVRLATPRAVEPGASTFPEVAAHIRDRARVERVKSRAAALQRRYPEFGRIMPTMLGNALRAGEDAAGSRYGLDAMTVYPRMYPTLSKAMSEAVARQLDLIALTASLCVSFGLGAAATSPVLVRVLHLDPWSVIPIAAALLSWLSYRGAIRAAEGHATLLATTFDLHRFDMVRSLHYQPSRTPTAEYRFNKALSAFLKERITPMDAGLGAYEYDHSIYEQSASSASVQLPVDGDSGAADRPSDSGPDSGTAKRDAAPPSP